MSRLVNMPKRDRAGDTRRRILEAAAERFSDRGYAATTLASVAQAAGVAVQTVYFVFHNKAELLTATISSIAWAESSGPRSGASWLDEAAAADDAGRRLAIAVEGGVDLYGRIAPLLPALTEAALSDAQLARAWQRIVDERRSGMQHLAELMARRGELRPGMDSTVAAAILNGVHRHEVYLAFTRESGWSVEAFKGWLFGALCRELLADEVAKATTTLGSEAVERLSFATGLNTIER